MTAKASRASSARQMTETSYSPFNLFADLPRRQLALMAQSAGALFRGSRELQRIQQEAAQRATEHYEDAVARLRDCDYSELMAVQTEMVRFNIQELTQYWQQLSSAGMKVQAEMVSSAREVAAEAGSEPAFDSLQRVFAATLNGSGMAATPH